MRVFKIIPMVIGMSLLFGCVPVQQPDKKAEDNQKETKTPHKSPFLVKSAVDDLAVREDELFKLHYGKAHAVTSVYGLPEYAYSMFDFEQVLNEVMKSDVSTMINQMDNELGLKLKDTPIRQIAQYCIERGEYAVLGTSLKTARLIMHESLKKAILEALEQPVLADNLVALNDLKFFKIVKDKPDFRKVLLEVRKDRIVTIREYIDILSTLTKESRQNKHLKSKEMTYLIVSGW